MKKIVSLFLSCPNPAVNPWFTIIFTSQFLVNRITGRMFQLFLRHKSLLVLKSYLHPVPEAV